LKRKIIIFIMIWVLFLLQTTVFKSLQIASTVPNLLLILTVSIAFMQGKKEGLLTGFICGILIDLFYGTIFGFYALVYMYIGYGCGFFSQVYYDEDIKVPLILTAVSDFVYGFIVYVSRFLLRGRINFWGYLTSVIMPEIVYTVLITIILYRIIYKINHSLAEKEKEGSGSVWVKS
jgi:rod shape-determining protein MreD